MKITIPKSVLIQLIFSNLNIDINMLVNKLEYGPDIRFKKSNNGILVLLFRIEPTPNHLAWILRKRQGGWVMMWQIERSCVEVGEVYSGAIWEGSSKSAFP